MSQFEVPKFRTREVLGQFDPNARHEMGADMPRGGGDGDRDGGGHSGRSHRQPGEATPIGLGAGAPSGAGASTVTFNLDQPIKGARLIISDPGDIVTQLTDVKADGDLKYTGSNLPTSAIEDTREGVEGLWVGDVENKISVTVVVTAAGTWMPYLVGRTRDSDCG